MVYYTQDTLIPGLCQSPHTKIGGGRGSRTGSVLILIQKGGEAKHASEAGVASVFCNSEHWSWYAYN
jgi:hypothetical protein